MLILIGSDGKSIDSLVSKRFGHAPYFLLYNTESKDFEVYENVEAEHHNHDNLITFLNKNVQAFIVGNIGPHAFEVINKPNIKIYYANKLTVKQAIEKLESNSLKILTEPTAKKSINHHDDDHHRHDHHHQNDGHHHRHNNH
jgi:predicted Fe-Mo cluster-binding NifX family protein